MYTMKRKLPPHIVLPDGRWRFVKKASKRAYKKVKHMAKRKGSIRYSRGFGGMGGMKNLLWPLAAGAIDHYANSMLPVQGVGAAVVGFIGKDQTLKTLGLYQIGGSIPDLIPGIGGASKGGLI